MARLPQLDRCAQTDQLCPSPVASSPILSTSPLRGGPAQFRMHPGTPGSTPILGTSPVPRDRCYLQGAGASAILGTSPKPCQMAAVFVPVVGSPLAQGLQHHHLAFFPEPLPSGMRTPQRAAESGVGSEAGSEEGQDEMEDVPVQSPYIVKNSFIDTPLQRSPSLERFFGERRVHSSPPSIAVDLSREQNPFMISTPTGSSEGDFDFEGMTASAQVLERDLAHLHDQGKFVGSASDLGGSTRAGSMLEHLQQASTSGSGRFSDVSRPGPILEDLVVGSAEMPSRGSALHKFGACKPCAFVSQGLCRNDVNCEFCHLCEPGEKKRRRKEWLESKREFRGHDDVGFMAMPLEAAMPMPSGAR